MRVGIFIYPNAEVLDFSGPYEVFATANRFLEEDRQLHVSLVAQTNDLVVARGGYTVLPHFSFDDCPQLDVLVVVGGVHTEELTKPQVINWVANMAKQAQLVASVCTGAFILAESGVLTNQKVTTHWEDIVDLRHQYPQLDVVEGKRWVDEGGVVTSGGISAGIDMSLHLISRLAGVATAEKTARQMEFDWRRN